MTWAQVAIGDVVRIARTGVAPEEIESGTPYVGLEHIDSEGNFVEVKAVDAGELASTKFRFTPRQVLFGKLRPYLKKTARPTFEGVCSTDILPLEPGERLDRDYLFHALRRQSFVDEVTSLCAGANLPRISPKVLAEMPFPLPPLSEQRRIAAILDKADALRAKRREAIAKVDQLLQSVFLEMFGDSARWSRVAIGEICAVKGGKRLPKGEDYASSPTPFRYIRVSDIQSGRILENQLKYLKPEVQARIRRYTVSAGDVVITIAGTIGVVAPVGPSVAGANLTENAAKLVASGGVPYEAEYLAFALSTPDAQRQIQSQTGQVTIGKLALFRIEKVTVPMPPQNLQMKFVEVKRAIERQVAQHAESLTLLDTAFAGLQQQAFSGAL